MGLSLYKQKRRFNQTPEPSGSVNSSRSKKLEFVVQKHHASHLHYDFRLEMEGVLKSWAVPKGPSLNPQDKRLAMMVEDHPYDYRKFEGVIPKGNYGAGNVIIWDRGTYEPRVPTDEPEKTLLDELVKGHLTFVLYGQKLKGEFALVKKGNGNPENAWLLIKKKDDAASQQDISMQDRSVVSGKRVDEIGEGSIDLSGLPKIDMPKNVNPMLATLTDEAFDDPSWVYEIKWDGYRAIGSWDGGEASLYSRNGNNFKKYGEVLEALRNLKHKAVIDGEIVVVDPEGKAHFEWLQNYSKSPKGQILYYAFDILWCDGHDLQDLPLVDRKKILKNVVSGNDIIRFSDHIEEKGREFFKLAQQQKLEGIMAKDTHSKYAQNYRSKQWLKIKTHLRQEVVIGGFTEPRGSRKHIGALILGVHKGDELTYVGHTGGGIPTDFMPRLRQKLEKLERKTSPFADTVKPNAPVHWVKPELVCEVSFSEWTSGGHMRHPTFIGMREDKNVKEVVREDATQKSTPSLSVRTNESRIAFTHQNKVFFPSTGYTKGDLIDYYGRVGERMLPYVKDRPQTLLRHPNGVNGPAFFQKDVEKVPDWITTKAIYSESNKKDINYLVVDSTDSLLYLAQLGCIEINPWNSRVGNLDNPDWAVLDLDPEGIGFEEVIKAANIIHELCEELKIPTYPKTSGKTGIHIFIPLDAKYDYEQTKQFSEILANIAHTRLPETTSVLRSPKKRQNKIYIDFLQNRMGQTLAAPYSVRPTPEATVSTPLHWDEVRPGLNPQDFTIKTIFKRLETVGELWCPVIGEGVDIAKVLDELG